MNDPAFSLALENFMIRKKYFENWKEYAKQIKEKAKKILDDENLKVFVFGSVVEGNYNVGISDIDIAIVSNKVPKGKERGLILSKLEENMDLANPFEIHLVTPKLWENWYKRFISREVEIK